MKNIRIFFTKTGRMKFVSHLDMYRFMSRIIKMSKIPVWYTEGYNPRQYINFALPLSLGFESRYEILDIKTDDDNISLQEIKSKLNMQLPEYIKIFKVAEPIMKTKEISYARFEITFDTNNKDILDDLNMFLNRSSIICQKKTKKGQLKEIDLAPKIAEKNLTENVLMLLLPAGPIDNINPTLLLDEFFKQTDTQNIYYSIVRTEILDKNYNLFI